MSTPARKVTLRPALSIKEIQRLRATQEMWRRIASDDAVRVTARANAQAQVARIERQITTPQAVFHG